MIEGQFYKFGKIIYCFRWAIIIAWVVLFLSCIPFIPKFMSPFKETGFKDPSSESAKADNYLNKKLGFNSSRFIILYKSDKWLADNPKFQDGMKESLKNLKNFHTKNRIIYPDKNNKQIAADKHSAYVAVLFKDKKIVDETFLKEFRKSIVKPKHLTFQIGGEPIFLEDTRGQTQTDLFKAEYIATPVAIITMLIVFGSVVAASLPIILGMFFAIIIFTILYGLGNVFSLSVFTVNIALLLGLCVNLDYALFVISRFRHEIRHDKSVVEAVAITQATAGKAVFFSGLAVLVSLSALLFFPINILFSVGMGGIMSIVVAVAICTILLPAVLAVLGKRIDSLKIPFFKFKSINCWGWLVNKVMRRPWAFFFIILSVLLLLAYPFFQVHFGISDIRILPQTSESRQVFDVFQTDFSEGKLAPISVVVKTDHGNILSRKNLDNVYDEAHKIKKDSRVSEVTSIVNSKPELSKSEYYTLYHAPEKFRSDDIKKLLELTTGTHFTVINVVSKYGSNADNTKNLIKTIRATDAGKGLSIQVAGASANTLDILNSISDKFVYAILWTMFFTYIILLILLRSLILPLKAIVMNILSLLASYGVLAYIFEQGHFSQILNFEPQGILDISLLIIIFCSLFGFSMDYEVFLLTRIKEEFEKTGDNTKSTICGIEFSGKIITSAAVIVILICFSFMSAQILIVKAFGLGIAVAIFVDAFLIRIMLVPATMALLGRWNWYLPKWLDRILPDVSFNPEGQVESKKNHDDFY